MSLQRIVIDSPETAVNIISILNLSSGKETGLINLATYLRSLAGGSRDAAVSVLLGAAQATGLVTFTGAPTAAQTVTIGNIVFTARASGAVGNEFNIGGTPTISATNLAAAINASASLRGRISATSALGVVTLTCVVPGVVGNSLGLSNTLSNASITAFANGADGTSYSL